MIHSETRSQKLIEKLNNLGLSISYERVLNIGSHIAASLCEQFEKDDAVIPCNLLGNTFTLYAVDNINFNPSSTILAERNATVAKSSINFGGVLLLNGISYRPQIGPILKV